MKLGVLRESLLGARIGTVVQIHRVEDYSLHHSWIAYEIIIPGVGVYRLPHKNALSGYVEILE
mgnify:CR=1 FL=1